MSENNKKNNKNNLKVPSKQSSISIIILMILIGFMLFKDSSIFSNKAQNSNSYVPFNEFNTMVQKEQVEYVFFEDGNNSTLQFLPSQSYLKEKGYPITTEYANITLNLSTTKETTIKPAQIPSNGIMKFVTENPGSENYKATLLSKGIRVFTIQQPVSITMIVLYALNMFLPLILIVAFMLYFQKRMEPAENELTTDVPDTKFTNIAGYEGLKNDSKFILDFLKKPQSYEKIGARLPNGVLFYGPPGTGKTLMAKAIAGEASVPFYKVNGSDFVELYVGLGARRVRKLYKTARETAPCIVFIDEIDSIGAARGNHRGSSEDDKTLTALLNELDGFSAKNGVITIAATNRLEDLDPALVRPGRFDRQVAVPLPNKEERKQILELYAKTKKLSSEIDIDKLAAKTIDFSPSELENLLNEAAIKAVTRGSEVVEQKDIDDSYLKIIIKGDKKEDKSQTEHEKKVIAYHEAGHALVGYMLGKPILEVSVIGTTSGAGGYTLSQPKEGLRSKTDMKNEIKEAYGGRAGEMMIAKNPDDITVGAVSDIQHATRIIDRYIKVLGLNGSLINLEELGIRRPTDEIIEQAKQISDELFAETVDILKKNRNKLDKLAELLLEKSLIDGVTFEKLMKETKEANEDVSQEKAIPVLNEKNAVYEVQSSNDNLVFQGDGKDKKLKSKKQKKLKLKKKNKAKFQENQML
ncbi:AAA family ATPase [Criibacterium bergeronii]|uniref:AAA family ATPase n=1 Tax=Criibacterium bergeronii TaxID=1871336 RepID=A0A552V4P3_9FIRM|nr:AAA family ATPase [Criibacterium bergeronii]TRW25443.1 AAA family ATPase [Criibacterium bergeronii]